MSSSRVWTIGIIGGESTGKTTLTRELSITLDKNAFPVYEFARAYLDGRDFDKDPFVEKDFITIVNGHIKDVQNAQEKLKSQISVENAKQEKTEEKQSSHKNVQNLDSSTTKTNLDLIFSKDYFVIVDTDAIVTHCWAKELIGKIPERVKEVCENEQRIAYDFYLIQHPLDVPYEADPQRFIAEEEKRVKFHENLLKVFKSFNYSAPYFILNGKTFEDRKKQAISAIEQFVKSKS